ncbi:hypothetical protein CMV_015345 [Castanea mollissima]|uniref:Uncharacterized protein n=1 Tax=Castanea mollissima TaxID=60419 RepID=A0A8J4R1S8_9ROSI|nr:hypothetical protein CMV_015345 [Castanea mollissima]
MHEDISNFGSILLQLSDLLLGKKIWGYIFLTEQDQYTYTEAGICSRLSVYRSNQPNSMDGTSELVKSLKLSTCKMIKVTT